LKGNALDSDNKKEIEKTKEKEEIQGSK